MRAKEIYGPKQAVAQALVAAAHELDKAIDVLSQLRGQDRTHYGPDMKKIGSLQEKILDLALDKYDANQLLGG